MRVIVFRVSPTRTEGDYMLMGKLCNYVCHVCNDISQIFDLLENMI